MKEVNFICQDCGAEQETEEHPVEPWPIVPDRCECGGFVVPQYAQEDPFDEDSDDDDLYEV